MRARTPPGEKNWYRVEEEEFEAFLPADAVRLEVAGEAGWELKDTGVSIIELPARQHHSRKNWVCEGQPGLLSYIRASFILTQHLF